MILRKHPRESRRKRKKKKRKHRRRKNQRTATKLPERHRSRRLCGALSMKSISIRRKFPEPVRAEESRKPMRWLPRKVGALLKRKRRQKIERPRQSYGLPNSLRMAVSFGRECRRCAGKSRRNW